MVYMNSKPYRNRRVESLYESYGESWDDIKNIFSKYFGTHIASSDNSKYRDNESLKLKNERNMYHYKYSIFALHTKFHSNGLVREIMRYYPLLQWEIQSF